MTCIPQSGGCERPFTEAFVEHLNRTDGSRYVHRACSDRDDRHDPQPVPQPEALYVDAERNLELVIERKSISWPIDYTYRHKKSHFAASRLSEELAGLPSDHLYEVHLPMLMKGTKSQLQAFALKVARQIRSHWLQVGAGSILKGLDDKWLWEFRRVPDWEKEEGTPSKGLRFSFIGRDSGFIDPTDLPEQLAAAVQNIYSRCVKKFASYPKARSVLALDPHAGLRYESANWWSEVFSSLPPPTQIHEIWSGVFDWVEEDTEGWVFERLR